MGLIGRHVKTEKVIMYRKEDEACIFRVRKGIELFKVTLNIEKRIFHVPWGIIILIRQRSPPRAIGYPLIFNL